LPEIEDLNVFPNPTNNEWLIESEKEIVRLIEVFDLHGKLLLKLNPKKYIIRMEALHILEEI